MSRSAPIVKTSESIKKRIDKAQRSHFYILQELGPFAFQIQTQTADEIPKKYKVALGSRQSCTCSRNRTQGDACIHLIWVMVKLFHIAAESELLYQKSLTDHEIEELEASRRNFHQRQMIPKVIAQEALMKNNNEASEVKARNIGELDVCPICQEELLEHPFPLMHCRFSCGNSIHLKCVKVLIEHAQSLDQTDVKCPLCRQSFGTTSGLNDIVKKPIKKEKKAKIYKHIGNQCTICGLVPEGKLHKCTLCPSLHICDPCFKSGAHSEHAFQNKESRASNWLPSERAVDAILPPSLIHDFEGRDLTDADYEKLLTLDRPQLQGTIPLHIINAFPVIKVKSIKDYKSLLLDSKDPACQICMDKITYGDLVRQIPCGHGFHQQCIGISKCKSDKWLLNRRSACPSCGLAAYSSLGIEDDDEIIPQIEGAKYIAAPISYTPVVNTKARRKRRESKKETRVDIAETFGGIFVMGSNVNAPKKAMTVGTRLLETRGTSNLPITPIRGHVKHSGNKILSRHGVRLPPIHESIIPSPPRSVPVAAEPWGRRTRGHGEMRRHPSPHSTKPIVVDQLLVMATKSIMFQDRK